jgi:cytochrome c-type biogenesis protein CcmF
MMLYPERRFFLARQETETIVAIQSTPLRDLYVVYAGRNPETGEPAIHAYLNPLVKCVWFGGLIVIIGTVLALVPSRQPVMVLRAVAESAPGTAGRIPQSVGVIHARE